MKNIYKFPLLFFSLALVLGCNKAQPTEFIDQLTIDTTGARAVSFPTKEEQNTPEFERDMQRLTIVKNFQEASAKYLEQHGNYAEGLNDYESYFELPKNYEELKDSFSYEVASDHENNECYAIYTNFESDHLKNFKGHFGNRIKGLCLTKEIISSPEFQKDKERLKLVDPLSSAVSEYYKKNGMYAETLSDYNNFFQTSVDFEEMRVDYWVHPDASGNERQCYSIYFNFDSAYYRDYYGINWTHNNNYTMISNESEKNCR